MRDSKGRISVLVADSTRMSTELISAALTRDESLSVVATVIGAGELTLLAQELRPEVLIIGAGSRDNPLAGCEITRSVTAFLPETKVVIMLDHPDRDTVIEAFRSGARGIFCRAASVEDLCKCVHQVHAGQIWAGSEELQFVLDALARLDSPKLDAKMEALLTSREQQIVRCVGEGLQNREIAERLGVSVHTVKNYLFRIFDKLGVSNRAELIFFVASRAAVFTTPAAIPAEIPEDVNAAFKWAQQASERLVTAQMMLGEMYRDGRGTNQDKVRAAMWLSIAEITCRQRLHAVRQAKERFTCTLDPATNAEANRLMSEWLQKRRPTVVTERRKSTTV